MAYVGHPDPRPPSVNRVHVTQLIDVPVRQYWCYISLCKTVMSLLHVMMCFRPSSMFSVHTDLLVGEQN
jgi:hypothetical protein